ncbi:unnamed protein product, partial [Enterobius vermicularis]|uniref:PA domain-containing protein n=1 Tax=Enterobius vermicularis TaxID=51028 RepID=A0A0N4V7N9_ENTVE
SPGPPHYRNPGPAAKIFGHKIRNECEFTKDSKNRAFVLDPRTTTVALSRAKEGVVIIRNYNVFKRSSVWNTYARMFPANSIDLEEFYYYSEG